MEGLNSKTLGFILALGISLLNYIQISKLISCNLISQGNANKLLYCIVRNAVNCLYCLSTCHHEWQCVLNVFA